MARPLPWEYLGECSETSLQNFMLVQLETAAKIRRVIAAESEHLVEALVSAEVARLLLEKSEEISRMGTLRQGILNFVDRRKRA